MFPGTVLYPLLNQWKNFGITGPEDVEYVGGNAKMNEFCAAMGVCNLRHVDTEIAKRAAVEGRYPICSPASPASPVDPQEGVTPNHAYMPVVFDESTFGATRDDVFAVLDAAAWAARKYFDPLASDYACYRAVYSSASTPVSQSGCPTACSRCPCTRTFPLPMSTASATSSWGARDEG